MQSKVRVHHERQSSGSGSLCGPLQFEDSSGNQAKYKKRTKGSKGFSSGGSGESAGLTSKTADIIIG